LILLKENNFRTNRNESQNKKSYKKGWRWILGSDLCWANIKHSGDGEIIIIPADKEKYKRKFLKKAQE